MLLGAFGLGSKESYLAMSTSLNHKESSIHTKCTVLPCKLMPVTVYRVVAVHLVKIHFEHKARVQHLWEEMPLIQRHSLRFNGY